MPRPLGWGASLSTQCSAGWKGRDQMREGLLGEDIYFIEKNETGGTELGLGYHNLFQVNAVFLHSVPDRHTVYPENASRLGLIPIALT